MIPSSSLDEQISLLITNKVSSATYTDYRHDYLRYSVSENSSTVYIHFIPFVLIFPVLLDILYWHSHLQKGSKGDSLNSLVRVEYGNTQLGESPKVETNTETHSTEYNFNTTFECTYGDPACLDAIAYKPVTGKYSTDFSKIHALSCRDCVAMIAVDPGAP